MTLTLLIPSQNATSIDFFGDLMIDASQQFLGKASFSFLAQLLSEADVEDMQACLAEHMEWRQIVPVPADFMEMQRIRKISDIEITPILDMIPTASDGRNVSGAVDFSLDSFLLQSRGGNLSDGSKAAGSILCSSQGGAGSPHVGRPSLSLIDLIDGG